MELDDDVMSCSLRERGGMTRRVEKGRRFLEVKY
jgi:hypothetical protein